jgi:outer membrane protein
MSRFAPAVLLTAVLLSFAAFVSAADLKIGFIDSERIFAGYRGTNEAQTEFNSDIQQWTTELEQRRQDLERITEEYQSQSLILSEAKRREREEDIQRRRSELDAFVQEIWGPSGQVAQRNEQLTRPIVEKIREVLNEIGTAEGFSIIFDATDGNVVYADDALDLTDRVLARLNEEQ